MPENYQWSETGIEINSKSQSCVATHLGRGGTF